MVLGTVVAVAAALTRPRQEALPALLLSLAAFGGNFCRSYFSFFGASISYLYFDNFFFALRRFLLFIAFCSVVCFGFLPQ